MKTAVGHGKDMMFGFEFYVFLAWGGVVALVSLVLFFGMSF